MKIKSFAEASEFLGNKVNRPYAHNTRIIRVDQNKIIATYHDNPVVTFMPDGLMLSSCGWKTITTKKRLNWFVPDGFSVYQDKSAWYLSDRQAQKRYIFADGITIDTNRNVFGDIPEESDTTKQTIKAIKNFVNGYVAELLAGKMEKPSGGDCWDCYFQTDEGQSLGDVTHNTSHILSHFEESYFVPSMIYNAYKHNNRLSIMAKDGIARLTDEKYRDSVSDWQKSLVQRDVTACLTSYLKHELNIAQ